MASKSHRSGASRSGASRGIRSDISSGTDIHALNAVVCHLKKPPSELQKFGGDPLLYHRFMRQFRSRVVANCESSEECLNYLEQYTTGEPQQIVIGYAYMDADKGYKAALSEFEKRYGDPDVTVSAFIQKALSWPIIKSDDPKEFDKFGVFCLNVRMQLNA